jgi:hypothetical protein
MSYVVDWSAKRFNDDLQRIRWQDADAICAAVISCAATGVGDIRRIDGAPSNERVLRVGIYRVRLRLDPLDKTLIPLFIWRFL